MNEVLKKRDERPWGFMGCCLVGVLRWDDFAITAARPFWSGGFFKGSGGGDGRVMGFVLDSPTVFRAVFYEPFRKTIIVANREPL